MHCGRECGDSSVYSIVPLRTAGRLPSITPYLAWCHALAAGFILLAASATRLAAQSNPDLDRAWSLYRSGSYEEAIALAERGRALEEDNEDWWRIEAGALFTLGRYREAYDTLGLGLVAAPDSLWLMLQRREAEHYIVTTAPQAPMTQADV